MFRSADESKDLTRTEKRHFLQTSKSSLTASPVTPLPGPEGGLPLMGSTGTKHSQIAAGFNGQHHLQHFRRATDPQLEVLGHRVLPKMKAAFSTALRNDVNDDFTGGDVTDDQLANRRGVVARKTPFRQKPNVSPDKVLSTTKTAKQNGGTMTTANRGREINGRKSHQANGRPYLCLCSGVHEAV